MLITKSKKPLELQFPVALYEAIEAFGLFSPEHVRCRQRLDDLMDALAALQARYGGTANVGAVEDNIACGSFYFPTRERGLILLKEILESADVPELRFAEGVRRKEVETLLHILLLKSMNRTVRSVDKELLDAGVEHIACGEALLPAEDPERLTEPQTERASIWELVRPLDDTGQREVFAAVKEVRAAVGSREILSAYPIRRAVERLVAAMKTDPDALLALVFRPQKENWLVAHAVRSCILALRLGIALTDDETTLHRLAESMLLNDVGLFTIRASILNKTAPLAAAEQEEIRSHTVKGAALLLTGAGFAPSTVEAALLHHADRLGEGYPSITATTKPSIVCQIVRIVDAYECMIGGRPYRAPVSPLAAAAELLCKAGSSFDGSLVGRFIKTVGLAPVGSVAVLSTGDLAEVVGHNPNDLLRPAVVPIMNCRGRVYEQSRPLYLAERPDITITGTIPLATAVECQVEYAIA